MTHSYAYICIYLSALAAPCCWRTSACSFCLLLDSTGLKLQPQQHLSVPAAMALPSTPGWRVGAKEVPWAKSCPAPIMSRPVPKSHTLEKFQLKCPSRSMLLVHERLLFLLAAWQHWVETPATAALICASCHGFAFHPPFSDPSFFCRSCVVHILIHLCHLLGDALDDVASVV